MYFLLLNLDIYLILDTSSKTLNRKHLSMLHMLSQLLKFVKDFAFNYEDDYSYMQRITKEQEQSVKVNTKKTS
jgi:hypothetical protein